MKLPNNIKIYAGKKVYKKEIPDHLAPKSILKKDPSNLTLGLKKDNKDGDKSKGKS